MARKRKNIAKTQPVRWARSAELKAWRLRHGLNKVNMVAVLRGNGLSDTTWATYYDWERGAVVPRAPYVAAIFAAIAAAEPARLEGDWQVSQPLRVTISKTSDGLLDYMQIMSADTTSVNIVLISESIAVNDVRPPRAAANAVTAAKRKQR